MLASLGGFYCPWNVELVGKRIVNGVDVGVGDKLFVRTVSSGNALGGCRLFRLREIAGRNRHDCGVFALLHGGDDFPETDGGGAENSPAEFFGHGRNDKGRGWGR